MADKYIAYVGCYTRGKNHGIHVYNVNVKLAKLEKMSDVKVENASYIYISNGKKYLYSVADEGVASFKIEPDGNLTLINKQPINGLRPCYISSSDTDKFLFTGGYHDGKVTVLKIKPDGGIGKVVDEFFHTGLGSVTERNFRPHVNCVILTPDNQYLCACDLGLDQVKIYKFDETDGKLVLHDIIRCELESGPRHMIFSEDNKYAYIVFEMKNYIEVYSYDDGNFTKIQTISTLPSSSGGKNASSAIKLSPGGDRLIASVAGNNSVVVYDVNKETGCLKLLSILPIAGEYPKDIEFYPDGKHIMAINQESCSITNFALNHKTGNIVMFGRPIEVSTPSCVSLLKLDNNI